jgi:hypothetical protein
MTRVHRVEIRPSQEQGLEDPLHSSLIHEPLKFEQKLFWLVRYHSCLVSLREAPEPEPVHFSISES